jgi:hypothetical protein
MQVRPSNTPASTAHCQRPTALAISDSNDFLAVTCGSTIVVLQPVQPDKPALATFDAPDTLARLAFSPDGTLLLGAARTGAAWLWRWATATCVAHVPAPGPGFELSSLAAFEESRAHFVAAGTSNGKPVVRFWTLPDLAPAQHASQEGSKEMLVASAKVGQLRQSVFASGSVADVKCGRDDAANLAFVALSTGFLCIFNSDRMLTYIWEMKGPICSLAVSTVYLACGMASGHIHLVSPFQTSHLCRIQPPCTDSGAVAGLAVDCDGVTLAALYANRTLAAWTGCHHRQNPQLALLERGSLSCFVDGVVCGAARHGDLSLRGRSAVLTEGTIVTIDDAGDVVVWGWDEDVPLTRVSVTVGGSSATFKFTRRMELTTAEQGRRASRLAVSAAWEWLALGHSCGSLELFRNSAESLEPFVRVNAHSEQVRLDCMSSLGIDHRQSDSQTDSHAHPRRVPGRFSRYLLDQLLLARMRCSSLPAPTDTRKCLPQPTRFATPTRSVHPCP